MTVFESAVEEFKNLPPDQKKQKLIELIQQFKPIAPVFAELEINIQESDYSDEILLKIYSIITKSMESAQGLSLEEGLKHIDELSRFLQELRQKELVDRQKEGDPDQRLDQILSAIK